MHNDDPTRDSSRKLYEDVSQSVWCYPQTGAKQAIIECHTINFYFLEVDYKYWQQEISILW